MAKTVIIDGDVLAFRAAAAAQQTIVWPSGYAEPFARKQEGETILDDILHSTVRRLGADAYHVVLSCPTEENWRLGIDPNYKGNRKNSVRPLLLATLREYCRERYGAYHWPHLEADDLIGILATSGDTYLPGEKIIVGRDKDFYTIPGEHYQFGDDLPNGKPNVRTVTPMDARMNHYVQALAGDRVDGYPGCDGIGMTRAKEIVANPVKLIKSIGVITRGANKGMKVPKWSKGGPCTVWETIVAHYEKAGQTEEDAIRTGRLAKILLHEDYNKETGEIRLWVPGNE